MVLIQSSSSARVQAYILGPSRFDHHGFVTIGTTTIFIFIYEAKKHRFNLLLILWLRLLNKPWTCLVNAVVFTSNPRKGIQCSIPYFHWISTDERWLNKVLCLNLSLRIILNKTLRQVINQTLMSFLSVKGNQIPAQFWSAIVQWLLNGSIPFLKKIIWVKR